MIVNDITTLQDLINSEIPESSSLEYKAAAAISDSKEITKDVSSMANGAGGIIIYGLTEKDNKPDQLDPIKGSRFSREYLDQVIAGGIQPPIKFKTEAIPYDGGYIYVVHIDQGETAHMSLNQHRYYRRYNFMSVAMEDYEIRDIMNRVKHPKITINFKIDRGRLIVSLVNESKIYAKYIRAVIDIQSSYLEFDAFVEEITKSFPDGKSPYTRIVRTNKNFGVLHRGGEMPLMDYPLTDRLKHQIELMGMIHQKFLPIYWSISADNAEVKEGTIEIPSIQRRNS